MNFMATARHKKVADLLDPLALGVRMQELLAERGV
jgi:hypothetical protein